MTLAIENLPKEKMHAQDLQNEINMATKWIDAFRYSLKVFPRSAYISAAALLVIIFLLECYFETDQFLFLGLAMPLTSVMQFYMHTFGRHAYRLAVAYVPRIIRMHDMLDFDDNKQKEKYFKFFSKDQVDKLIGKRSLFFFYARSTFAPALALSSLGWYGSIRSSLGMPATLLSILAIFAIAGLFARHLVQKTLAAIPSLPVGSLDEFTLKILETPQAL